MVNACAPKAEPLFGDVPYTGTNMSLGIFAIDAIRNDCGFEPDVSFAEGTKRTMEWLKTIEQK
jgi:nucleoside-diphosphate-sugar epimerase